MAGRGILSVVSGFSGSGKGTIMKALLKKYDNYAVSISATTRQMRSNEKPDLDYFFISDREFEQMIADDELYEYACYQDHYYGTPKRYVDEQLDQGKDVILEIEVQGAEKIKARFPDTVLIFVTPPSARELKNRLVGRGTETADRIEGRLKRAAEEADLMDRYDYILVNDQLDACVDQLDEILRTEHKKASRNKELIKQLSEELQTLTKGE
jgi:guanylate kinase